MKERPILFSGPMVRTILAGQKTQTRRLVKPQPSFPCLIATDPATPRFSQDGAEPAPLPTFLRRCPFGQPGDRLWVREAWMPGYEHEADHEDGPRVSLLYRADNGQRTATAPSYDLAEKWEREFCEDGDKPPPWRPSIHMPRWACRITLEITGVRVERLQSISETDCWAEGIAEIDGALDETEICRLAKQMGRSFEDAAPSFACLWESLNGSGSWDANPWVWVVEFRRIDA